MGDLRWWLGRMRSRAYGSSSVAIDGLLLELRTLNRSAG
jgi:hypothetical protein